MAGRVSGGYADGTGTSALFGRMFDTFFYNGQIYVTDATYRRVRRVTTSGTTTLFAGSGSNGNTEGVGSAATFGFPMGITVSTSGIVYVTENTYSTVRTISTAGMIR